MNSEPMEQDGTVERYSPTHPPMNEAEAVAAIDELKKEIVMMEAQLDHPDPLKIADGTYNSWRHRATFALGLTRQEVKFLENWVKDLRQKGVRETREKIKAAPIPSHESIGDIAAGICAKAQVLAEAIGGSYTPCYTKDRPPENMDTARQRFDLLSSLKLQLQGAFSEISAEWASHPLRRDDVPRAKAPLQKILTVVEMEICVVKGYIRTAFQPINLSWRQVCVNALTRAVEGGFVLTEEERSVLEQLKRPGI